MAEHTPTPWRYDPTVAQAISTKDQITWADIICYPPPEGTKSRDNFTANAAFIVRACNAHDELVAALREAQSALNGAPNTVGLHSQIDLALTKATAP